MRFFLFSSTAAKETPESNQTSSMSSSLSNSAPPHFGHLTPSGRRSLSSLSNHISAPSFSKSSASFSVTFTSRNECRQDLHRSAGMGTPQALCLDRHQSGLLTIML